MLAVLAVPTVLLARRFMMHAQLLAKSRIDTKTGLLNVSTWESEAEREIARATRPAARSSIAMINIDRFKIVNDTRHLVGTRRWRTRPALRERLAASVSRRPVRRQELRVLLPQTPEAQALRVGERLAARVEPADHPGRQEYQPPEKIHHGIEFRLTVSVGSASLDRARLGLTDLLAAADAAPVPGPPPADQTRRRGRRRFRRRWPRPSRPQGRRPSALSARSASASAPRWVEELR